VPRIKDETRAEIRRGIEAAALQCFVRRGYAATTTREIAQAVGLTPGALYAHYAGKEQLFASVVDSYRARLVGEEPAANPVRRVLAEGRFPWDIPRLAAAVKEVVSTHQDYWKLWYVDVIEFDGRHFQSALAPQALLARPELQARFTELRRQGALRLEPELAFVMTYMHLFNYFLVEVLFGGSQHYGVSEDAAIEAMSQVFLHGVLAPGATPPPSSAH
jgi:AcrR family transcriptional regulator